MSIFGNNFNLFVGVFFDFATLHLKFLFVENQQQNNLNQSLDHFKIGVF